MAQLTANTPRSYEVVVDQNSCPVKASTTIYLGSAVGIDSSVGYARQLTAGDEFKGFAEEKVDNSAGASGDKYVTVKSRGVVSLAIASIAITDEGKPVYASDGATFTLTQSTNTRIGTVHRWISTGIALVKFDADPKSSLNSTVALTDSSGGSASDTLAAISAGYVQAEVRNSIASLAAKINLIIAALK